MAAPINRLESIWSRSEVRDEPEVFERATVGERAKKLEYSLEGLFAKHPKVAIAAAAAVGIALGLIVKRK